MKIVIENADENDFNELAQLARTGRIHTFCMTDEDEWIPVSERLPSDNEPCEVLCCDIRGEIMIGYPFMDDESVSGYSAENEGCFMYECIAWKPLPEPYKKGGAE